jgi:hypothetical protein
VAGPQRAGYSGTPLAKKLGIREGIRLAVLGADPGYAALVSPLPAGVRLSPRVDPDTEMVHLFVTRREELGFELSRLRRSLGPEAVVWVSWPKKASKVPTTVTEETIRELALPLGFVDIKVCAVSEVWSGLKLVVRKALRGNRLL